MSKEITWVLMTLSLLRRQNLFRLLLQAYLHWKFERQYARKTRSSKFIYVYRFYNGVKNGAQRQFPAAIYIIMCQQLEGAGCGVMTLVSAPNLHNLVSCYKMGRVYNLVTI